MQFTLTSLFPRRLLSGRRRYFNLETLLETSKSEKETPKGFFALSRLSRQELGILFECYYRSYSQIATVRIFAVEFGLPLAHSFCVPEP